MRSVFYSRAILKSSRSPFARLFFVRSIFYSRAILKSSRFLFAHLSLCAALYYSRAILKSSLSLCYPRAILKSSRCLFARLSLSAASSIYAPFYMRSIFYSRAILKSSQSLFARHSEKRCVLFCFWVCPMEHINCSSLHLPAIVHGGERYFVQEDLLSHEYSPPRPSVS